MRLNWYSWSRDNCNSEISYKSAVRTPDGRYPILFYTYWSLLSVAYRVYKKLTADSPRILYDFWTRRTIDSSTTHIPNHSHVLSANWYYQSMHLVFLFIVNYFRLISHNTLRFKLEPTSGITPNRIWIYW